VSVAVALRSPATSWLEHAACRGRPTSWWYAGDELSVGVALSICRRCPVRSECLDDALTHETSGYRFGIRAGLTANDRAAVAGSPGARLVAR
jgi:WhiB family redox-sensing transcriptional regulator